MATFNELERAAWDVIQKVKQIQEFRHTKLSVIGGLALWHYLPEYRSTDNINFITSISTSPSSLKKRLLELPDSPFYQRAQILFYVNPEGKGIQIDISPEWLSPYLPKSAAKVQDISQDEIPYISLTDLIVFKLDSSGLRSNPAKKDRDARDAAALVDLAAKEGDIELSERQQQVVEEALCDVARCGSKEKVWWQKYMGLEKNIAPGAGRADRSDSDRRGQSRSHSKSDPSPSRSRVNSDASAAWHYERLDLAHVRRFNSLHSSGGTGRPALARSASASHRLVRDTAACFTMTQPKTTHASYRQAARRSGLSNEVSADAGYDDDRDDEYYNLEPRGSSSERSAPSPSSYSSSSSSSTTTTTRGPGYFDLTPPGGLGTVTEHGAVAAGPARRTSRTGGYFDVSPGAAPRRSTVTEPNRPPGLAKRSVSFLL
ncbi:hypothetical protein AAE478_006653 [Parahypoxylon ruwenzoriense]